MLGLKGDLVIVGAGQIAAPSRHGYTTASTAGTRLILVSGTSVPIVVVCKLVSGGEP
jgi:hypothetical protein